MCSHGRHICGQQAGSLATSSTSHVSEVSHYLDHIQPAIDQLAAAECHHFKDLDPYATPEECFSSLFFCFWISERRSIS